MTSVVLTKSDFTRYRACPHAAWMAKHRPHDAPADPDPLAHWRTRDGIALEALAMTRFPDAVDASAPDIPTALARTRALMADPAVATIAQASIVSPAGYFARLDVLERRPDGWAIREIKSCSTPDTTHRDDLGFQVLACRDAGLSIVDAAIVHVDRAYRRQAGDDVAARVFTTAPLLSALEADAADIVAAMAGALAVVRAPEPPPCRCHERTRGSWCAYAPAIHAAADAPGGIHDLRRLHGGKLRALQARGIARVADIPGDVELSAWQQRQVAVTRAGVDHFDAAAVGEILAGLQFPLHFLDYESFSFPIPRFDGFTANAHVPFQYSLHIVAADGALTHRAHLALDPALHPAEDLLARLAADVGRTGSIVVWSNFERGIHTRLAEALPHYSDFLADLTARLVDLEPVVGKGHWVHPAFRGSSSIKAVLPVITDGAGYTGLAIHDGGTASAAWRHCLDGGASAAERAQIEADLLAYCAQDTLAMVEVWRYLQARVASA
jgi:hypothetical protein